MKTQEQMKNGYNTTKALLIANTVGVHLSHRDAQQVARGVQGVEN